MLAGNLLEALLGSHASKAGPLRPSGLNSLCAG
jgi:hypothetical protein